MRPVLILSGLILLVVAAGLLFMSSYQQVVNDSEWNRIARDGRASSSDGFLWSDWRPNDGSVHPFPRDRDERYPETFPEYRIGRGHGWLFTFTTYELRYPRDGVLYKIPAVGPDWGASYRWIWTILTALSGIALLVAGIVIRKRAGSMPS